MLLLGIHRPSEPVPLLGNTFDPIYINYDVLIGTILVESYAFKKVYAAMNAQIEERVS